MKHLNFKNVFLLALVFVIFSVSQSKSLVFNKNAYIAASIIKTLGAKENFKKLIIKFVRLCPKLRLINIIKSTVKKIEFLTSEQPINRGIRFAKSALRRLYGRSR